MQEIVVTSTEVIVYYFIVSTFVLNILHCTFVLNIPHCTYADVHHMYDNYLCNVEDKSVC